jgi:hypothetical protein
MKTLIGLVMFTLVLSVGMVPMLYAADVTESPTPKMVDGDLLKIDGEFYVVKNHREAGKEVRLHVDKTTTLEGAFKAGDKIEAKATETDHALMIKHAQSTK